MAPDIPSFGRLPISPSNVANQKRGGQGGRMLRKRRKKADGTWEEYDEEDPGEGLKADVELESDSFAGQNGTEVEGFLAEALPWEAEDAAIAEEAERQAAEARELAAVEARIAADFDGEAAAIAAAETGASDPAAKERESEARAEREFEAVIRQAVGMPATPAGPPGASTAPVKALPVQASAVQVPPPEVGPGQSSAGGAVGDGTSDPEDEGRDPIAPPPQASTSALGAPPNASAGVAEASLTREAPAGLPRIPEPRRGTGKLGPHAGPAAGRAAPPQGRGTGGLNRPTMPARRNTGSLPALPTGPSPYLQGSYEYRIVDGRTGAPVAAMIELTFMEARLVPVRRRLQAGADGWAKGQGLPPGRYQLTLVANGYHPQADVRFLRAEGADKATYRMQSY